MSFVDDKMMEGYIIGSDMIQQQNKPIYLSIPSEKQRKLKKLHGEVENEANVIWKDKYHTSFVFRNILFSILPLVIALFLFVPNTNKILNANQAYVLFYGSVFCVIIGGLLQQSLQRKKNQIFGDCFKMYAKELEEINGLK